MNKMLAVLSLGRVVSKASQNTALNCLKNSSSRPLAYTRLVQDRSCKTRSFSSATIIPSVGSEHQSDIPSPGVLSRLNVFDPWRDEPQTHVEREQQLAKKAQEAQRQEGEEEQKKQKERHNIYPYPVVSGSRCGTTDDQSQHESHGSEEADTGTGTDASVPD